MLRSTMPTLEIMALLKPDQAKETCAGVGEHSSTQDLESWGRQCRAEPMALLKPDQAKDTCAGVGEHARFARAGSLLAHGGAAQLA